MLNDVKDLEGFAVGATDGELGKISDLYFDDEHWAIRYLVVETGGWLRGRKVLISPSAVRRVGWDTNIIDVRLTRQQVQDSPSIDTDKPVSRQHEMDYHDYYGYPYYWEGAFLWGRLMYPVSSAGAPADSAPTSTPARLGEEQADAEAANQGPCETGDSHLRSCNDVVGHEAMATDGAIGSVKTFLFDDESWAIRLVVVNTANWLPGKRVLLQPEQIQGISWPEREVYLGMTREQVKASPEYAHRFVATFQIHE